MLVCCIKRILSYVVSYIQGCSTTKRGVGTPFPHHIKRKTAPNSSNEVSIRLQEFPHWIFLLHCKLLTSSAESACR